MREKNTDRLMPEIETLNWVLNEILVLEIEGQIVVELNCRYMNRQYASA